jgi:hypothetical protein
MINLVRLPNQHRGEKTKLFLRRHWIELFSIGFYALGFAALPFAFYGVLFLTGTDLTQGLWMPLGVLAVSTYSIVALLIVMTMFTDYYLDTWIVTTERIINIEQLGLFSRVISTLHLNQVQDVTAETHGFFPTILTYGDVHVQTAGSRERFRFRNIDNPEVIKQTVVQLVEDDKRRHGDATKAN